MSAHGRSKALIPERFKREGSPVSLSHPLHLLLIDDHAIVRDGMAQLLQRHWPGCRVTQADSWGEAQAPLSQHNDISLVLLDMHLPDSDPLQALRELRAAYPQLRVAMLSGDTDPQRALATLRLGAVGYLPKASDTALLVRSLQWVLDGGTYQPPFLAGLHAELINRMVFGNKVIDHERISGVREQAFELAIVYEVIDGLIRRTWTISAD